MVFIIIVEVLSAEDFYSNNYIYACVLFVLITLSIYNFIVWSRGLRLIIMEIVDRRFFLTICFS